jgi:hypothetical protein
MGHNARRKKQLQPKSLSFPATSLSYNSLSTTHISFKGFTDIKNVTTRVEPLSTVLIRVSNPHCELSFFLFFFFNSFSSLSSLVTYYCFALCTLPADYSEGANAKEKGTSIFSFTKGVRTGIKKTPFEHHFIFLPPSYLV